MYRTILPLFALLFGALFAYGQDKPSIKQVAPTASDPTSGKAMFTSYCSACHGKDGKGGGPAAAALKKGPSDLTILARRNGGKFPTLAVQNAIAGESGGTAAHGSKEMPVWGDVFRSMTSNDSITKMRMHNLVKYIESIQVK
ncbi:MAG: cytochrome c [Acidobacteria bacterium]|nr:cytochrome c [Acidobacteriota bacterium]